MNFLSHLSRFAHLSMSCLLSSDFLVLQLHSRCWWVRVAAGTSQNAHFGMRSKQVACVFWSWPLRPHYWATMLKDFDFSTPKDTTYLISGMLHPIPAASVAQIIQYSPLWKLAYVAFLPFSEMSDENTCTQDQRCGSKTLQRNWTAL